MKYANRVNIGLLFFLLIIHVSTSAESPKPPYVALVTGSDRGSGAFVDNVASSRQKKIIALTSPFASSTLALQNRNIVFYSMSKAALNRGMRSLQAETMDRGILVGLVSPGPVVDVAVIG